jgi:tetratricopeptide (TPR) repeat protein
LGGLVVLWVIALAAQAAAPPAELTKGQKAKLAQRDRLEKSLPDLVQKGQNDKAVETAERIVALEREVLGETDGRVVASLQRLAGWREALGQYVKAIRVRQEIVRLQERRLGKDHWQTTDARLDLQDSRRLAAMSPEDRTAFLQARADHARAVQLHQQGKFRQAVQIAAKVLAVRRVVLGERHPDYATSLNNLAELYRAIGEPGKALPLLREVRESLRQALGERHPHYAHSLHNLASLYKDLGEHGKALPLALEARDLCRQVLGQRHRDYATSLNNLAWLYRARGEHGKALTLFLEARRLRRKVLGEKHPDYTQSLHNLGMLYREMGEPGKALPLLREALKLRRQALGERHPDYALILNSLAGVYYHRGEHGKALPLLREARRLYRQALGERHPAYATSLNNLAGLYRAMGEPGKALPLSLEARDLRRQVLGERHPHYALCLNNLAMLYHDMGEPGKALPWAGEALRVLDSFLENSFDSLGELHRLQLTAPRRMLQHRGSKVSARDNETDGSEQPGPCRPERGGGLRDHTRPTRRAPTTGRRLRLHQPLLYPGAATAGAGQPVREQRAFPDSGRVGCAAAEAGPVRLATRPA